MDITFKFGIGNMVTHPLGFDGQVIHANVGRTGNLGYYIEYVDKQGCVREAYVPEQELIPA